MDTKMEKIELLLEQYCDVVQPEISDEANKALKLVKIDEFDEYEMAAVRIGRVIEKMLTSILLRLSPEDDNTKNKDKGGNGIESILGALGRSGFKIAPTTRHYIDTVRVFRNNGAHDKYLNSDSMEFVLLAFKMVIEWYVKEVLDESKISRDQQIAANHRLYAEIVKMSFIDGFIQDKEKELLY